MHPLAVAGLLQTMICRRLACPRDDLGLQPASGCQRSCLELGRFREFRAMRHVLISISILLGMASATGATPVHGLLATMVGPFGANESIGAADHVSPIGAPANIHSSDSEIFRRFGPESDAVSGHVHFRSPDIMSGLREDRAYGDDPEGSLWLIPVNWDARTGSLIPIQAVFGELPENKRAYATIAAKLREALIQQVWNGAPERWAQAINAEVAADPVALSVFT